MAPRSGFGPESRARQARMIGRYTTGALFRTGLAAPELQSEAKGNSVYKRWRKRIPSRWPWSLLWLDSRRRSGLGSGNLGLRRLLELIQRDGGVDSAAHAVEYREVLVLLVRNQLSTANPALGLHVGKLHLDSPARDFRNDRTLFNSFGARREVVFKCVTT